MQEFQDKVPGLRGRLAASVRTGEDGIRAWRAKPELDAWITFESWYRAASSETDFIALPDDIGPALPPVRRQYDGPDGRYRAAVRDG
jgi:accessory colonization factor AcfC